MSINILADDVKRMRETTGMGLMECKRILVGRRLREKVEAAVEKQSFYELADILLTLIDDRFPDNPRV